MIDQDIENRVLGAILLDASGIKQIAHFFKPEYFSTYQHQCIANAILDLINLNEPIDIITVSGKLKSKKTLEAAGGYTYITSLTDKVSSAANVEYHMRIVMQEYLNRCMMAEAENIINKINAKDDVFDVLDSFESVALKLNKSLSLKTHITISELHDKFKKKNIEILNSNGVSGVGSGLRDLDFITGGWQAPDVIIIAARPGMGKTAMVVTVARNAVIEYGKPTAIFSLEMSSLQIYNRIVAGEAEINSYEIQKGLNEHTMQHIDSRMMRFQDAPLFIDDTAALSVFELRTKCRKLKHDHNIGLIVIDYLQLMTCDTNGKSNREGEISFISRSIKQLAKELDVPIIVLSQLSRSVEQRGGSKIPMLSDLRESGSIEQDADIVIFPYRPEYYGINEDAMGRSTLGQAHLIIAKNRNGKLDTVECKYIDYMTKFVNN